jgi:hypothetical protein
MGAGGQDAGDARPTQVRVEQQPSNGQGDECAPGGGAQAGEPQTEERLLHREIEGQCGTIEARRPARPPGTGWVSTTSVPNCGRLVLCGC